MSAFPILTMIVYLMCETHFLSNILKVHQSDCNFILRYLIVTIGSIEIHIPTLLTLSDYLVRQHN